MRKIKVGAIQPKALDTAPGCGFFDSGYDGTVANLMENYIKPQLETTFGLLEQAGEAGLDIVTTSEDICLAGSYLIDANPDSVFPKLVNASTGYLEERISGIALKYNMYIIACYFKSYEDGIYNIASIFGRDGKMEGTYKKTHLPPNEKWHAKEGDSLDVFDLDFGRIGILICYDMMFPDASSVLGMKGAEIVFHPTYGYGWYNEIGEATLKTRANDNSFYIVTAKDYRFNAAGKSGVIDYWGHTLAEAGFYANRLVWTEIDLDIPKTQPDWYYPTHMSGTADVHKRSRMERRPDLYALLSDETLHPHLEAPDFDTKQKIMEEVKTGRCRW